MYSETFKHRPTTSQSNDNNLPQTTTTHTVNPYRQLQPQQVRTSPQSTPSIDSNIVDLLQRDEHLTHSPQSQSTRQASSPSTSTNTTSQYEPTIIDDPIPDTRPLRTRSKVFLYPDAYDPAPSHQHEQSTSASPSDESFQTPTFHMSASSSSSSISV